MYYVYVLKSLKFTDKIYVGYTSDLKKRVALHMAGSNNTTRNLRPLELVYYEAFKSKTDAHSREKQLKHYGNALGHLKRRIVRSLGVKKVRWPKVLSKRSRITVIARSVTTRQSRNSSPHHLRFALRPLHHAQYSVSYSQRSTGRT